ncbi:hypothetical protein TeGR_g12431 [Tetraparma gracilis]|uniref:AAA+ ATPase domain-containing protein n=1 Tax=Tetraparma gracilis TaxID=2962635 RepID=A0ABQ6MDQ7_9STRA|nr:hypothetical protein TeGR_g12431 [Tetraparma gracilis]
MTTHVDLPWMQSSKPSRRVPGSENPLAKLLDLCEMSNFKGASDLLSSLSDSDAVSQLFHQNSSKFTPLHLAIYKGAGYDLVETMIKISKTDATKWPLCSMVTNTSYTPLFYAAAWGNNVEMVRLLIRTYPDALGMKTTKGQTPLVGANHFNKGKNKDDIVKLLEEASALHSRNDTNGLEELTANSEEQKQEAINQIAYVTRQNDITLARTALTAAIATSFINNISKTLNALAALDVPEDDPLLVEGKARMDALRMARKNLNEAFNGALDSIQAGNVAELKQHLTKTPALLSLRDPENVQGRTLLHYASDLNKAPCVDALLAALNANKSLWTTPQDDSSATFLVKNCASPVDSTQRTPLHDAVKNSHTGIVKTLLSNGAVADARDGIDWSPLHWASRTGNMEIALALLKVSTAPLESQDTENRTPLLVAAENEHFELVKVLVNDFKANPNARNKRDESAADIGDDKTREFVESYCFKQTFDVALTEGIRLWKDSSETRNAALSFLRTCRPAASAWKSDTKMRTELHAFRTCSEVTGQTHVALEKIRDGSFDILTDNIFDANKRTHDMLHLALAFASQPPGVCSVEDVRGALDKYEEGLGGVEVAEVQLDPLYLLAHARLAEMEPGREYQRVALLLEFQPFDSAMESKLSWLKESEQKAIIDAPKLYHKMQGAAHHGRRSSRRGRSRTDFCSVEEEWANMCIDTPAIACDAMDELMNLTGLESVKSAAISIYTSVLADAKLAEVSKKQTRKRVLNFAFVGNPGTGKSTVARIFARVLESAGVRSGNKFIQMTGSQALRKGARVFATELASLTGGDSSIGPKPSPLRRGLQVEVCKTEDGAERYYPGHISFIKSAAKDKGGTTYSVTYTDGTEDEGITEHQIRAIGHGGNVGGVLFLDEAYDLDPAHDSEGKAIMAEIMSAAEDHRDKVTIILAGYKDDIENKLYAFNSGMASRFRNIDFEDFDESQLKSIWESLCKESGYECDSKKTSEVAARRLARGAMRKGFGNARTVRKLVDRALESAERNYLKAGAGAKPLITVFDVIGKRPTFAQSPALKAAFEDLNAVTGLHKVKEEMYNLLDMAQKNFEKEEHGFKTSSVPLNRLFLGNPGTGKTTIAKIYGRILKALNFLEKGDVVFKSASDFLGSAIGESERKTAAILELAQENVLIVDEAYAMDDQMFGKRALDTFVEKLQGEGIAVVLIGYEAEMKAMFRNQNPGLSSRFDFAYAIQFQDFTNSELLAIIADCCRREEVSASIKVKVAAVQQLAKRRDAERHFGNARAANNLVSDAIKRMASRIKREKDSKEEAVEEFLTIRDIEGEKSEFEKNPLKVLEDLQGDQSEGWKKMLLDASDQIYVKKAEGKPLRGIVKNMIFIGPPGTGKTTVARKMASILYGLGMLATDTVVETSGANLTGQHVGTTKKIVEEKMSEARGGILFVDEAYGVTGSNYGQEAIDTLCGMLTLDDYADGKTIVIMGGYKKDMYEMMEENEGLKSRFSATVEFENWSAGKCAGLVEKLAGKAGFGLTTGGVDLLKEGFAELSKPGPDGEAARGGWANARDAVTMFEYVEACRNSRVAKLMKAGVYDETDEKVSEVFTAGDCKEAVNKYLTQTQGKKKVKPKMNVNVNARAEEKKKGRGEEEEKAEDEQEERPEEAEDKELDLSKLALCVNVNYNRMDAKDPAKKKAAVAAAEKELEKVRGSLREKRAALEKQVAAEDEEEAAKTKEEVAALEKELMEQRKKELLRSVADCENHYSFRRFGDSWVCEGGRHEVSEAELMRAYRAAYEA